MRQRGEKFILAPIRLEQRALGVFQARDVEIDAGPALHVPGRVANRHALREDGVVGAIDAAHAVLAIPHGSGARAFLPGGHGRLDVIGMQHGTPAVIGSLPLSQSHQAQQGVAAIDVAALRIAHPNAVVDGLADGAVELFAGLERPCMRLHLVEHVVERVDDHADLIVCHLGGAEGVIAFVDDLACHRGHRFHRLAHHALQPAGGEQGGDESNDHHGGEHRQIGAHPSAHVVLRAQVDSAQRLAALHDGSNQFDPAAFDVDTRGKARQGKRQPSARPFKCRTF